MQLSDLYSRAACASPADPALVDGETVLSWSDVDTMSAALAGSLMDAGIGVGDRVALARRKAAASYLAVHGILRAGAVVVPIDAMAPARHGRRVLADADVAGVVGDAPTISRLDPWTIGGLGLRAVVSDGAIADGGGLATDWTDALAQHPDPEVLPPLSGDDLAYVIYTSGSTGTPKGIVHTHRSAMAYAERAAAAHGLSPADRVGGISGFHYDMSTFELYAAPHARASVVVMGEAELRFPASFVARSAAERVTVWYAVTSMLRQVVERGAVDAHDLSSLRSIMFAGEVYSPRALNELFAAFPGVEITNVYGPAEVNECSYHVLPGPPTDEVPIGPIWAGGEGRVVDREGNDVPVGSTGELWVSAPTVMQGYWRRPDLTAQSLHAREDGRPAWYATGDLVRADADGVLWFRGRADNQVKLRGNRIELEGVESVLCDSPDVMQAVAGLDRAAPDASNLVAAVVLKTGSSFDEGAIRRFCVERLPAVAVPRHIEVRDDLPLTPSGKIDRAAVRQALAGSEPLTETSSLTETS